MPGHRPIPGADLRAQLRRFGPPGADVVAFEAHVAAESAFTDLAQLVEACPPERAGLTVGAFTALFGPLFGEFE